MSDRMWRAAAIGGGLLGLSLMAMRAWHNHREKTTRWQKQAAVQPRRKVVIAGAGFGGLFTTLHLSSALCDDPETAVILVDQHNFHLFTPLLTAVAGGLVDSQHVAYPVRRLERKCRFFFREGKILGIDLQNKVLEFDDGVLSYDYLVLALGSITNFFGMRDIERVAFPFKTVGDAIRLRNRVISIFEKAAWESDAERRRQLLTFVFCGAGATGVELAASVRDFIYDSLIEEYPNLDTADLRLVLMEAQPRVLPALSVFLSSVAEQQLRAKGIELRLGERVVRAIEDERGVLEAVETDKGERILTHTLIWTAGIKANPLVAALPVAKDKNGAVQVDEYLGLPGVPNVYALGDNAAVVDPKTGRRLPPDAKVAVQLAKSVAKNIVADLSGMPKERLRYDHLGELVLLGTNAAVAEVKGLQLSGLPAFLLWRSFYFGRLLGLESKARVAWDYLYGLFAERDTAQMDIA